MSFDWDLATWIVNVGALIGLISGMARSWLTAGGKMRTVYWLMIWMGSCNVVTNVAVLYKQPEMIGLFSYMLLSAWSVAMGVKGLMRLGSEG